jgi:molecular chaperone GrpE
MSVEDAAEPALTESESDPRDAQIEQLRAQVRELEAQALRTVAEAQTIQRRMRAQFDEERKLGTLPLAERTLPVLDALFRAQESAASGASVESLAAGLAAVERQLRKALEDVGVSAVPGVGSPFDPSVHEAVAMEEGSEGEEVVVEELEPGYTLHGRLVRAARVKVGRRPAP